ncbi:MAG: hypothetical protein V2I43_02370 [Parvularcula sp.]|jgi:hypothetical protein|nr:hypothetical protein [Parvularcula sp.]
MTLFALMVGAGLAALLLITAWGSELHRNRGFYATLLIAISFFYPVFAWERFQLTEMLFQLAIAAAFVAIAVIGYRRDAAIIVLGLFMHAGYDVVAVIADVHAPSLWQEFCFSFDLTIAAGARLLSR